MIQIFAGSVGLVASSDLIRICQPPFFGLLVTAFLEGIAGFTGPPQTNGLLSLLPHASVIISVLYAFNGAGSLVSPFLLTPLLRRHPENPFLFSRLLLLLDLSTLVFALVVIRTQTAERILEQWDSRPKPAVQAAPASDEAAVALMALDETSSHSDPATKTVSEKQSSAGKMRTLLRMRFTWAMVIMHALTVSAPYLVYAASSALTHQSFADHSINHFAVLFLRTERGGSVNAGYVSSALFAGASIQLGQPPRSQSQATPLVGLLSCL